MAREEQPELIQIRASAGSGKTYTLAMNYMARLSEVHRDCASEQLAARAAEILAITFTNAAAEEMRQRVLVNLKKAALGLLDAPEGEPPFPRGMAHKWLDVFLEDMGALNIRTIDSLLHQIIRACAVDLGLAPEYETVFDTAEALGSHVDKLLEDSRKDRNLRHMLSEACEVIINSDKGASFSRGQRIRDDLNDILGDVLADKFQELTPPGQLMAALESRKDEARSVARQMLDIMGEATKNKINLPALAVLNSIAEGGDNPNPQKAVWAKNPPCLKADDVKAMYNKGGTPPDGLGALYNRLRNCFHGLGEFDILTHEAARYYPLIKIGEAVARYFAEDTERNAVLPQARAAMLASSVLKPLGEVSTALCRMGDRLRHYLIDEFQDTSQEQWNVLQALVLEAASQGGSMVWVGDPKQSIYGWRGGKPELFDRAAQDKQLVCVASAAKKIVLGKNWRSAAAIVRFNNSFFSPLKDTVQAARIVQSMLSKESDAAIVGAAARRVSRSFADIEQIPAGGEKPQGYVRVENVEGDSAGEVARISLERLRLLLLEEIGPRMPWSDVLILTRSNAHAREIAECLAQARIPAITDNGLALHENILVRQLVAFFQFLDDPHDDVAFWALVSGDIFALYEGASDFSLEYFTELVAQRGGSSLVSVFAENYPSIWAQLLRPFFHQATMLTPYDLLMEWLKRTRAEERFPADRTMLRRFMETVHGAESSGYGSLSEFLIRWREKGSEERAPMPANMNAVRIMTIHKAKGLERRVVIVPGTSFPIKSSDRVGVLSCGDFGLAAAKVRKEIRGPYQEDMCRQAQEALNLLYVAFTRPVEELYVFYTKSSRRTAKTASHAIGALLDIMGGQCPLEAGQRPALSPALPSLDEYKSVPANPEGAADPDSDWRPMGWLPHLKIFHTPVRSGQMTSREAGILVHAALANWRQEENLAASIAIALDVAMVETGLRPDAELLSRANGWLSWLLGHGQIRSWLVNGHAEQSMVDADGNYMRADLLVPLQTGCLVADFKTGAPRDKDIFQVQAYMRCVNESGQFSGSVVGLLIYLSTQKFQTVTPDGYGPFTSRLPAVLS